MAAWAAAAVDTKGRQEKLVEIEMEDPPATGGGSVAGPSEALVTLGALSAQMRDMMMEVRGFQEVEKYSEEVLLATFGGKGAGLQATREEILSRCTRVLATLAKKPAAGPAEPTPKLAAKIPRSRPFDEAILDSKEILMELLEVLKKVPTDHKKWKEPKKP
ncbi:hypothetical protein NE237_018663 [Protea cynaroides]|uniref:Uncharacterized protein n=1 Tax=Protea cynaroides TaxID=273540 RepID=A0A9Q0KAD6_9MAGN|nr:hypothetical protein NE237_018663 [Protea cynaroides]